MLTEQQHDWLFNVAAPAAVESEQQTGLPAELSLSQSIFESAYGNRSPQNNCFGIKADDHGSGVQYVVSREFLDGTWITKPEAFESYATLGDCFTDHARLITQGTPYKEVWQKYLADHDLQGLVDGMGPIYGTDPQYAEKIWGEIQSENLQEALRQARGT